MSTVTVSTALEVAKNLVPAWRAATPPQKGSFYIATTVLFNTVPSFFSFCFPLLSDDVLGKAPGPDRGSNGSTTSAPSASITSILEVKVIWGKSQRNLSLFLQLFSSTFPSPSWATKLDEWHGALTRATANCKEKGRKGEGKGREW